MATTWPDKPCPYCQQIITDLLVEMVPDTDQGTADHQAINNRKPGGAVTCPYCQEAIAYDVKGEDLVKSGRIPLRYVVLIRLIKAWARAEGRKDEDIFNLCSKIDPPWPWSEREFHERELEIGAEQIGEDSLSPRS